MYMDKSAIIEKMTAEVAALGCFIVDASVSKDNDVVLEIESEEGIVDMDMCVAVNDAFLRNFDKDAEDYALTVTSAGLDQPFKVLKQYLKAVGNKVDVRLKGGLKVLAVLEAADENGITIRWSAKEAVEGQKKKQLVEHTETFPYEETNSVVPHIDFE